MRSMPAAPLSPRPRLWLFGALIALLLAYLLLQPALRRLSAETKELRQRTTARQVEAARAAAVRASVDTARSRAARDPSDATAQMELARRCLDAGLLEEATRSAQAAAKLRPADPEPWL